MGYWGHEPKDGDQPLDKFSTKVGVPVLKSLAEYGREKLSATDEMWTRVGVVQIALEAGLPVPWQLTKTVIKDIERLLADDRFLATWDDPDQLVGHAEDFQGLLRDLLASQDHQFKRSGVPKSITFYQ